TKNSDYKTGGTDAFEFIELYNSTGTPLNLKGFTLKYLAGTTEYVYPTTESKIVAPQETFIIWFKNSTVLQVGLPEFNTAYGSAIT
ncbi:lamin tail domain-containing protein, partial [Lysinibacillus sp. GbtcB16]|uniref:lamin tail domain-containing protein n=1 Tax=Lysinibacillus sp. GbtcB16 TaxID=2824761 RepID=UPI001C30885E